MIQTISLVIAFLVIGDATVAWLGLPDPESQSAWGSLLFG